ncbi:hypothetical protein QYE76_068265 [Lolium multiflorum]|uniref:Uncharacterized protein n=1 Tax=Lolium multiflorum TaxID=4521 RepID=A0AAD8SGF8_LOLMU|nr:hypothetical protein QYE76_068265 [Lolium multiflorum]
MPSSSSSSSGLSAQSSPFREPTPEWNPEEAHAANIRRAIRAEPQFLHLVRGTTFRRRERISPSRPRTARLGRAAANGERRGRRRLSLEGVTSSEEVRRRRRRRRTEAPPTSRRQAPPPWPGNLSDFDSDEDDADEEDEDNEGPVGGRYGSDDEPAGSSADDGDDGDDDEEGSNGP